MYNYNTAPFSTEIAQGCDSETHSLPKVTYPILFTGRVSDALSKYDHKTQISEQIYLTFNSTTYTVKHI